MEKTKIKITYQATEKDFTFKYSLLVSPEKTTVESQFIVTLTVMSLKKGFQDQMILRTSTLNQVKMVASLYNFSEPCMSIRCVVNP